MINLPVLFICTFYWPNFLICGMMIFFYIHNNKYIIFCLRLCKKCISMCSVSVLVCHRQTTITENLGTAEYIFPILIRVRVCVCLYVCVWDIYIYVCVCLYVCVWDIYIYMCVFVSTIIKGNWIYDINIFTFPISSLNSIYTLLILNSSTCRRIMP
jgi:hypothetical protein